MKPTRASSVRRCSFRAWRLGTLAGMALLLAACVDGYPDEDVPNVHPRDMSAQQRIAVMNQIGKDASPRGRWRYHLVSSCSLQASQGPAWSRKSMTLQLQGDGVSTRRDDELGAFVVQVVPDQASAQEAVTVLDTLQWTDVVQMRSMLELLRLDCRPGSGQQG